MNFLIINTKTSIGTYFLSYFKSKHEHQIIDTNYELSSKNKYLLNTLIEKNNIDTVIYLNDTYDIEECQNKNKNFIDINKKKLKQISQVCNKYHLPIIYISSAEVYGDINDSDKQESDICDPINNLGLLSLECENTIKEFTEEYFILRCSWIFGDTNCYIKQIINNAYTPLFFCNDKIVNPTSIESLAKSIEIICLTNNYGIFNYGSRVSCSKIEFTKFIFYFININKEISTFPKEILSKLPPSSKYSGLDVCLFEEIFNFKFESWKNLTCDYITSLFK